MKKIVDFILVLLLNVNRICSARRFLLLYFIFYSYNIFALPVDSSQIKLQFQKGVSFYELGQLEQAEVISRKGLKDIEALGGQLFKLEVGFYNLLGDCALDKSQYLEAQTQYEKAETTLTGAGTLDDLLAADVFNKLGNYFREIKEYDRALTYLNQALTIRIKILGDKDLKVADVYNNIGNCWIGSGAFDTAIDFHQRALTIRSAVLSRPNIYIGQSYNNLGISLIDKRKYEEALNALQQAYENYSGYYKTQHPSIADVYVNIGDAYEKKGNLDLFIHYQKLALELYKQTLATNHSSIALCYNNLANGYSKKKDYKQAKKYYQLALDIRKDRYGLIHPDVAESQFNLAMTYKFESSWQEAEVHFKKSLDALQYSSSNFEDVNNHQTLLNVFLGISETLTAIYLESDENNHLAKAYFYLEQAVQLVDYLRIRYETIGSKLQLVEQAHLIFERAIELALVLHSLENDDHYYQRSFEFAEKSRALLLLEAVNKSNAEKYAGIPDEKIEGLKSLERKIDQLEKLRYIENENQISKSEARIDSLDKLIFDEKLAFSAFIQSIKQDYPSYFNLRYATSTVSIDWIQKNLIDEGESLLEYFLGVERLYFFVINKDHFEVRTVELPDDFRNWLSLFNYAILQYTEVPSDSIENNLQQYAFTAYKLYQTLIAPVEDIIQPQLLVIPDGVLGLIPFEALLAKYPEKLDAFKTHDYLINKYTFSFNYSSTLLMEMIENKQEHGLKLYLGFAPEFNNKNSSNLNKLLYNGEEISAVQELIGGDIFIGPDATKNNFLTNQTQYEIIHLATHAKANFDEGDFSFLAFSEVNSKASADKKEALLYVKDIYGISCNANLVVLSACQTGIGTIQTGEGIASIARSFSYAGAKSLLATQWNVEDKSTNELMSLFFQYLKKGHPKNYALRESKLIYLTANGHKKAHPFYWASFINIGSMSPIKMRSSWTIYWLASAALFIIGIVLLKSTSKS